MTGIIDANALEAQMFKVCIDSTQPSKKQKDLERTCQAFLKQLSDVEKQPNKKQYPTIEINAFPCPASKPKETNQPFIFMCLLYLFVKLKSLKIQITERATRSKDGQTSISLVLNDQNKSLFSSEFDKKLWQIYQHRDYDLPGKQNHFNQLSFRCVCDEVMENKSRSKSHIKVRWECEKLISIFYEKIQKLFPDKPLYLLKNSLIFVDKQIKSSRALSQKILDFSHSIRLTRCLKRIFTKILLLKGLPSDSISELAQAAQSSYAIEQQNHESSYSGYGYFGSFEGKPLEYLEHLGICMKDVEKQFESVKKLLQNTPNLSIIEIAYPDVFTISNIDPFLTTVAQRNPLMKKIVMKNIRMVNISPSTLEKLYLACPFLVQLSIGLRFSYSILDTYEYKSPEEKEVKQNERAVQILLEALRLRKITLNNSIDMTKLLLKKNYSFISALQVVDSIQPICF